MSKCRQTLSLLRTATPSHHPHRSFATGLHSLPSASHSISNPSFPSSRSYEPSTSLPDSTATSSRYTLDHPFWFDKPDPAVSALDPATDDELFQSLLLPTSLPRGRAKKGRKDRIDWMGDPASTFLALRSRPTYTAFLQCIHPFLSTVYPRLKAAGQHDLLVSDLLLRHPDPRLLRDLLELDAVQATSSSNPNITPHPNHLRPSLIASIWSIISYPLRRNTKPLNYLDYRTHLLICRSFVSLNDIPSLVPSWQELRKSLPSSDKESSYLLLTFVASAALSDPVAAFGMLHTMIKNDFLPRGILLRGLGEHPKRRELIVLGAVIRSCLHWKMDIRAREHAGDFLDMLIKGDDLRVMKEALDLVLEVCRGAEAAGDPRGLEWCTQMFLKMGIADRGPKIPGPLFDAWLESVFATTSVAHGRPRSYALSVWTKLPTHRRPIISPTNILRLSTSSRHIPIPILLDLLRRLSDHNPSTTHHIAVPILRFITSLKMSISDRRTLLNTLLHHWSGSLLNLGGADLVRLVKTLRADKERCTAITKIYEARLVAEYSRRGDLSVEEGLAMVNTHLLVKDREGAEGWLEGLELNEQVKKGLWEMGIGNSDARVALKIFLRKRCETSEVKKILAGDFGH